MKEVIDVDLSPSSGLVLKGGKVKAIVNIFKPFLLKFGHLKGIWIFSGWI